MAKLRRARHGGEDAAEALGMAEMKLDELKSKCCSSAKPEANADARARRENAVEPKCGRPCDAKPKPTRNIINGVSAICLPKTGKARRNSLGRRAVSASKISTS
jgi:hypothetical protein